MIASSRLGKLIALLLAGGAHGALALAFVKDEPIQIEGAAGAAEVRLGTAFADMAAGTLSALDATEIPEPTPPEPAKPLPPQEISKAETPPPEAPEPVAAEPAPVPELTAAEPDVAAPALRPRAEQAEPVERLAALTPQPSPLKPVERPERVKPIKAEPVKAEPLKAEPPEKAEIKPQPKPKPVPKGNAKQNARAGQTTGKAQAKATTSGSAGNSKSAGNAAVSNYPGLVMRKLSRAPKPRINARGAAVVAFRVSDGGGLAAVSISRSSGSAALDQAALRVVQRAAPFPAPPSGARRSFSVRIKGR